MYESNSSAGLELLAVNLREGEDPVSKFVDDFGMSYPVLLDRNGEVARTWRIGGPNNGVPSTYFIDSEGVVQKVVFGYVTESLMAEGLALILEGS
jgi:peroxiredoxin